MTIDQMNKTIEKMRDCYPFKNSDTEIILGRFENNFRDGYVSVIAEDSNGTIIKMERKVD